MAAPWVDEPPISLRELLLVLWERRSWLLAATALIGGACGAYALLATPVYSATTVLSPVSGDRGLGASGSVLGQVGGLASLAGISLDNRDSGTEEALAVLRSREFVERFIADHNLLPQLFPGRWDAVAKRWKGSSDRQPTLAKGFKYFNKNSLSVARDKKTGFVTVTVDWRDRNEAANWANELVARVNAEMRARAVVNAAAYTEYLEKALESTQLVETRGAINRLIEAQIKQRMVASVTQEYAFRTVDRALPPDADDFVSPKRALLMICGLLGGLLLGCIGALVHPAATGQFVPGASKPGIE